MSVKFNVGDKVKVVRRCDKHGIGWYREMTEMLGREYVIDTVDTDDDSVRFDEAGGYWWFPMESIELVNPKFIDGVAVSVDEFEFRTSAPVEMSVAEIQEKLGFFINVKGE